MLQLQMVQPGEVARVLEFIQHGRGHLKAQGVNQWQGSYPDGSAIQEDIDHRRGYFLVEGREAVGYLCLDFGGEPAYAPLEGCWLGQGGYGVIHRFAMGEKRRGQGLGSVALALVAALCRQRAADSIRVDTDVQNRTMQHLLAKNGFAYRGQIWLDNRQKLVYEKLLAE